jgi:hypothetical protein
MYVLFALGTDIVLPLLPVLVCLWLVLVFPSYLPFCVPVLSVPCSCLFCALSYCRPVPVCLWLALVVPRTCRSVGLCLLFPVPVCFWPCLLLSPCPCLSLVLPLLSPRTCSSVCLYLVSPVPVCFVPCLNVALSLSVFCLALCCPPYLPFCGPVLIVSSSCLFFALSYCRPVPVCLLHLP